SDIDAAYARVRAAGATPTSPEPQTIPVTNAAAAGIRAFYFRDGEGHNLELIWYPPGKGDPRWQDARGRLFLGIDHTAIGVADTDRSVAFYRDLLGMEVKGGSLNEGIEQERLSGVPGARVRITGLRGAGGPGVQLLEYLAPAGRRPAPASALPPPPCRATLGRAVRRCPSPPAGGGPPACAPPARRSSPRTWSAIPTAMPSSWSSADPRRWRCPTTASGASSASSFWAAAS